VPNATCRLGLCSGCIHAVGQHGGGAPERLLLCVHTLCVAYSVANVHSLSSNLHLSSSASSGMQVLRSPPAFTGLPPTNCPLPAAGPSPEVVKRAKQEIKRILEESTEKAMRRETPAAGRYSVM